jgi:hypothetical protein
MIPVQNGKGYFERVAVDKNKVITFGNVVP